MSDALLETLLNLVRAEFRALDRRLAAVADTSERAELKEARASLAETIDHLEWSLSIARQAQSSPIASPRASRVA